MSIIVIPLTGLLLTMPVVWAVTALTDRHHTRADDHARELAAIDQWLDAIRATP